MIDHDEAKRRLYAASTLRVPSFGPDEMPATKIGMLEDFAIQAAIARGDLEEARLWMSDVLHGFTVRWAKLDGWEMTMPGGKRRKDATRDDIAEAKRQIDPDLWENISDLKHLVAELSNQIRRLEKDEDRVSRVYSFIVGS